MPRLAWPKIMSRLSFGRYGTVSRWQAIKSGIEFHCRRLGEEERLKR
jgi:hypothetical protein